VQGGLVGLHDQDVGGLLGGDQPVGVGVLGVQCVGGDHGGGEVQPLQQRLKLGDLVVGGVVDVGLDSPIAARELAPASTAATATASTVPSVCRRPCRWRGSASWAR
jgi:hypothetical protein